jgi:hypothetical protein
MKANKKLLAVMEEIEKEHFRTVEDTGANPCALLVWNALRRRVGLPSVWKEDLASYDDVKGEYVMPKDSKLLTNKQS